MHHEFEQVQRAIYHGILSEEFLPCLLSLSPLASRRPLKIMLRVRLI